MICLGLCRFILFHNFRIIDVFRHCILCIVFFYRSVGHIVCFNYGMGFVPEKKFLVLVSCYIIVITK